jgi:hypothetical protein
VLTPDDLATGAQGAAIEQGCAAGDVDAGTIEVVGDGFFHRVGLRRQAEPYRIELKARLQDATTPPKNDAP